MAEFSRLIAAAEKGDDQAAAELWELVYSDIKQLAAERIAHEAPGHTLQATALVHEVYLRLFGIGRERSTEITECQGRQQFFAAAATAMRRILLESARRKKRQKRGGKCVREDRDLDQVAAPQTPDDLLALDEALTALEAIEPKIAKLVTLRYFAGLTIKEAAAMLGVAPRTADAHWAYARAWFLAKINSDSRDGQRP